MSPSSSSSRSRPRRHSTNDEVPSKQPSQPRGHRRATISGPAPTVEQDRSSTATAGILKSHNDADITASSSHYNRVSFSSREDGSIRNHIASFDVDASPKECTTHCVKVTQRRSLQDSMLWPPPSLPFGAAPAPSLNSSRPVRRYSTMETAKEQNAAAVPRLPFSRRRSDGDYNPSQQSRMQSYSGVRSDYSLGDVARCTSHMIIQDDPQEVFDQVSQLKQHDFAFIRRTDGLWTYAILSHSFVDDEGEECMMFVMHQNGSTKTIRKKKWVSFVRLVADKMVMEEEHLEPSLPRNVLVNSRDRDDISMISFPFHN
jgi:hypothetical protein